MVNLVYLSMDDVIRGLKRLKSLAKQDILVSRLTPDPEYWSRQAHARKETYERLMSLVAQHGVTQACEEALDEYASLPPKNGRSHNGNNGNPELNGEEQALEVFFRTLGMEDETISRARSRRESTIGLSGTS